MTVETGDQKSASWQFIKEISRLWQIHNPDEDAVFVPRFEPDLINRFMRLKNGHSKMVIAPMNSVSDDLLANEEIKIVTVLWKVYLAPLILIRGSETVTAESPDYWFIPHGSSIIPGYSKLFKYDRLVFPLNDTAETGIVHDLFPIRLDTVESEAKSNLQNNQEESFIENDNLSFFAPDSTSDSEFTLAGGDNGRFKNLHVQEFGESDNDRTTGLFHEVEEIENDKSMEFVPWPTSQINATIVTEQIDSVRDFTFRHPNGVVLYEMLGPVRHLRRELPVPLELINLDRELITILTDTLPWVKEMYFSRSRLRTVGLQMALYVNATEDIEFIENLIKLLRHPPRSHFKRSYIMQNLSTSTTRDLSPFALHPGTLKYFNLD